MSAIDTAARLRALMDGAPVPLTAALPFPRVDDDERFILAFVRMGGESLPWGVAFGRPGEKPQILTVPEARDRDQVAAMCAQLSGSLDAHLGHPALEPDEAPNDRQLWTPGGAHVEMLHLLALRYGKARHGDPERLHLLHALARACGYLFREHGRPGQMRVFDAARTLRELYALPAEDIRQAHLGFALAWHESPGDAAARRVAARQAERRSVGVSLDPDLENDVLAPLVTRYREADGALAKDRLAARIHEVLAPELTRRFALTERALRLLDADPRPENPCLDTLRTLAGEELEDQYRSPEAKLTNGEDAFILDAETDHAPPGAAARFFAQERSQALLGVLAHGDPDLVRRLRESGDAIEAEVTQVVDENPGRGKTPVWTLVGSASGPLRLREGAKVCLVGQPKRTGRLRRVEVIDGERHLELEITGGKTRRGVPNEPDAHDPAHVGRTIQLVAVPYDDKSKQYGVWKRTGPGAWLTHSVPRPAANPQPRRPIDLLSLVEGLKG
ncbi:MAG: hypothetical protein RLO52_34150 [Sandaracinaceae bacterium]